ncbi:MAG: hypothetical protein D6820_10960, partial [Lentisphaerae bacterium]
MKRQRLRYWFMTLMIGPLCFSNLASPADQSDTCRRLKPLPPPGVHPRLFFTRDELQAIRERLDHSRFGRKFKPVVQRIITSVRKNWKRFAESNFEHPTPQQIERYFRPDEGRNISWGVTSLYAFLYDDAELKRLMIGVVCNYARLLLASRELKVGGEL